MNMVEIAEIENLVARGFVTKRKHPDMDIYILNYTPRAQFENNWTPTLMKCRGLIVDSKYNIIKKPFPKFFNLGERLSVGDLPDETPVITEKLEGFLGILYSENDLPAIATRGTFNSPMAVWATKWIRDTGLVMDDFLEAYTYIFEIIDPVLCRNQGLLINYGDRSECVLLAVIETATGLELDHKTEAMELGLPFAEIYTGSLDNAISEMPIMNGLEEEGYVCRYNNGFRIKLKADDYKRLHRLLSGLTPKKILNTLIEYGDGGIEKMIAGIPDESYARVHRIVDKIKDKQAQLIVDGKKIYDNTSHMSTNAERATEIHRASNNAVAFAMLNGRGEQYVANISLKQVRKTIKDFED